MVAIKKVSHLLSREMEHNHAEVGFLLSCLGQPNIVQFKKALQMGDQLWIVTEFLEGGTLGAASKAYRFTERHIAFVAHEMLQALTYLHSRHLVHRDLKSANVMLSIKGQVKLIDFGLCCDLGGPEGSRVQLLGSPCTPSPPSPPHPISLDPP